MSQVMLAILYQDVPGFPVGTVVQSIQVDLKGPGTFSQTVPEGTGTVTFHDLDPGTYSYGIAALDASGAVLGTPLSGSFDIPVPTTITLSLPSQATATVS